MIEPTNPCRFTAWYDIDTLHAICGKCLVSRKDVTQPQQPLLQRDTLVGSDAHDGVNAADEHTMKHGQLRMQPTNECQDGCKHCTRALE